MAGAVQWQRGSARTIQCCDAFGREHQRILRMAGVEPLCGRSHARSVDWLPERRAGGVRSGHAPNETGMDDPAGEERVRKMMGGKNPNDEIRNPKEIRMTNVSKCSAELHSAVSQNFNLLSRPQNGRHQTLLDAQCSEPTSNQTRVLRPRPKNLFT